MVWTRREISMLVGEVGLGKFAICNVGAHASRLRDETAGAEIYALSLYRYVAM